MVETEPRDRMSYVLSLIVAIAAAEYVLLVLPIYIGAIIDTISPGASSLSLLASVDLIGIAVAALASPLYIARIGRRRMLFRSLIVLAGVNFGAIFVHEPSYLIGLRFLAGLAAGSAFSVAVFGVATTVKPDRNSGLMVVSQVVLGAASIFALSQLDIAYRLDALFGLGGAAALLAALLATFAAHGLDAVESQSEGTPTAKFNMSIALAIIGTGLFFFTIGAVWGYIERIGLSASLLTNQISYILSFSFLVSLIGSILATVIGLKFGRIIPFIIAAIVQIPALLVLARLGLFHDALIAFAISVVAFQLLWTFIVSYQLLTFAGADPSGRFSGLFGAASHAALACGSFFGVWIVKGDSYSVVPIYGIAALLICYAAFVVSNAMIMRAAVVK